MVNGIFIVESRTASYYTKNLLLFIIRCWSGCSRDVTRARAAAHARMYRARLLKEKKSDARNKNISRGCLRRC